MAYMQPEKLTDESIMKFGKYKGKKMANVPADYLAWLADNPDKFANKWALSVWYKEVVAYISDNAEVLAEEMKKYNRHKAKKQIK